MLAQGDWLTWQLADSAFPTGGFAHSSGLESAYRCGEVGDSSDLIDFVCTALTQSVRGSVPFVTAAYRHPNQLTEYDKLCDVFLNNHVANRASRRQGQALVASIETTFQSDGLSRLGSMVKSRCLAGHLAPVFGVVMCKLGLGLDRTQRLFLFGSLRGLISSAVRLGVVGPLEGQSIQHALAPFAETILKRSSEASLAEVTQTAPVIDILQASHDRLYSRLFQS